jgi:hypothetical protein
MQHDPDIPCFELGKQALKDAGIPKKQKWKIKNIKKWVRITAALIMFGPVIVAILWMAIVNLSRYLQK